MRGAWPFHALLALAFAGAVHAGGPAEAEIESLIDALSTSGCEFERNGRWHGAERATAHLRRKYDWLRKRDLAPDAETFIERAASESSVSGQAYRVRCPGRPVVPSSEWFSGRLDEIRNRKSLQSGD